jgi:hypothetical protein
LLVIPLAENSKKTYPHLLDEQGVKPDTDGVPLCLSTRDANAPPSVPS